MSARAWKIISTLAATSLFGVGMFTVQGEHSGDIAPPTLVRLASPERSKEISLGPWVDVAKGERHEFPDVTVDATGTTWVTWLAFDNAAPSALQERIALKAFHPDGSQSEEIILDNREGKHLWPRIASRGNTLWVTWCTHRNDRWTVQSTRVVDGVPQPPEVISSPHRDAVRPAIAVGSNGRPWVAWEEKRGPQFAVVLRALDAESRPMTVGDGGELNMRPSLAPGPDGEMWVAWDTYADGRYSVWARPAWGDRLGQPIRLTDDDGWNLAPSADTGPDGTLWVTWHSNYDPTQGRRTISQRLRIAAIQGGELFEPAAGQPPPIQASLGGQYLQVEDTVEFPNLEVDTSGRLWITARRGQGFFGLIGDGDGWHGPYNLARMGWGGRGRDLRLAAAPDGSIQTVARRMHRVALQRLEPPADSVAAMPLISRPTAQARTYESALHSGTELVSSARARRDRFSKEVITTLNAGPPNAPQAAAIRPNPSALLASVSDPLITTSAVRRGSPEPGAAFKATVDGHSLKIDAKAARQNTTLLIGDLHTHSWHSDGTGDPDQIFARSRDERGLDFVALTDHDISNGNVLSPGEFAYIQLITDFFNDPSRFVTLKGYEWTSKTTMHGGSGHKNVYFPGNDAEFYGYGSGVDDTTTLFALLKQKGAVAIPHHIGWTGTDWEAHDPEVQPDFEIVSVHGAFEYAHNSPIAPRANLNGMFVRDGLAKGLRFGIVGGSDGHGVAWHYGVSRKEDPWSTGLTGAFSPGMNRRGLVTALKNRRCYATSGSPMMLHIGANGVAMGEEVTAGSTVSLSVKVGATSPLKEVILIRDGADLRTFTPSSDTFNAQIHDANLPIGEHFYYVRAVQADGEVAWSSPIFVTVASSPLEASVVRPSH